MRMTMRAATAAGELLTATSCCDTDDDD